MGGKAYTRIADRYEQVRGGAARAADLVAGVRPWLPAGLVCDVGAGTGVVTDQLQGAGVEVVACDLSQEMLRQAAPRLPGRVHVADATSLALRDRSIDAALFVWVLHHVDDVEACLTEAHRVLRTGGRLVAVSGTALPADDDLSAIFQSLLDELQPDRHRHVAEVTRTAGDVGFEVLHEGTVPVWFETTPNALIASVQDRLFAPLWDLPDATWDRVVAPALDAMRALPGPDVPRRRPIEHPLLVCVRTSERPQRRPS